MLVVDLSTLCQRFSNPVLDFIITGRYDTRWLITCIKGNSEATGVWLDTANPQKRRKICAIGVKASRYITMHGFALNLNTDLSYFQAINPCGFINGQVASIHTEMLRAGCTPEQLPTMQAVSELLYKNFCTLFTLSSEQD